MKFLLDTNVISEARKPAGSTAVKSWLSCQAPHDLAISVITVLEIDIGIRRLGRRDPLSASLLQRWLDERVLVGFAGRILTLDLDCVRRIAPLHVPDPAPEHDAIIAATALAHSLTVVTRNSANFARTGVALVNPWQPAVPPGPTPRPQTAGR